MAKPKRQFKDVDLSKPILSDAECTIVTGMSKSTMRRLTIAGKFPPKKDITSRIKGRETPGVLEYMRARGVRIEVA